MPKKFKGENSKAVEARARKETKKVEEQERKAKAAEDELWKDEDKHLLRKQNRKDEKEKKRIEALERKKENAKLAEEELAGIKVTKPKPVSSKMTRAEIEAHKEKERQAADGTEEVPTHLDVPLEENLNRLQVENEARNVDEAIAVLGAKEAPVDLHPEKRMKAAYAAFEKQHLPRVKEENPKMRLTQLKQIIWKDWMKSPENPLVQRHMAGET